MRQFFKGKIQGVALGKVNYLMAGAAVVISVLLLVVVYKTNESYDALRQSTDQYIALRSVIADMQLGSDYLTEQVRCFEVTGERNYLDNYFREANSTKRRDHAMEMIEASIGDSEPARDLRMALEESMRLMSREFYAMRLTVEAFGYDLSLFPQEIQDVELTEADAALTGQQKEKLGRKMVFDVEYRREKQIITANVNLCLESLNALMNAKQYDTENQLSRILQTQRRLIIGLIVITLLIVALTSVLVILPLRKAVSQIREDQLIPVKGAYEFRFLAETYNIMYEVNRKSKEHLAYEASHDKLTGLYNRGGYDFLMKTVDLADSALLLVDVDFFKEINDTHGHEVGDRELAWIASVIRGSFRSLDNVCRIGGDEFAVIMLHVGPDNSALIHNKVCNINAALANPGEDLPTTSVSVGVAFGCPDMTAAELYRRADAALYRVKQRGRAGCEIGK